MKKFNVNNIDEMTSLVKGKKIDSVSIEDDRMDDFLVFTFMDKTQLRIKYDYIYECVITD